MKNMNLQRNKRNAKVLNEKPMKVLAIPKVSKPRPLMGSVHVGRAQGYVPYSDYPSTAKSSESELKPIQRKLKKNKGRKLISIILRRSGFNFLSDIGDEIAGKY